MTRFREPRVPPTYDLRALGEDLEIYHALDRLADWFLEGAEERVGAAFARVDEYAACAARQQVKPEEFFKRTTRERYLVELLATVVMTRQLWPAFVERQHTVLLLPDCLAIRGADCGRKRTRYGPRCAACDPECQVSRITVAARRLGADAYFADLDHAAQIKRLIRGKYRDLSLIGVACIWMLAGGMRAAELADVPSQGVLLNYCGCEHWTDPPMVTDTVVARVEQILERKLAAARSSAPAT